MYSNKPQPSGMCRLPYRKLQTYARVMRLPGNMKYDVLWDLVKARKMGNERLVSQLLAEQKRIRLKRRIDKRIAKIKAETDERMRQVGTKIETEIANQRPRRVDVVPVVSEKPLASRFAELFDSTRRYEMKVQEYSASRKARILLPATTAFYNQFPQYHSATPVDSSSTLANYCDIVPPFSDVSRDTETVQDLSTYFKMKMPEYRTPEPKKSFQIEDIIASAPTSTTFSSVYTNSYLTNHNHLVDCLPTVSHSKELSYFQIGDTLDPWRKNEGCDSPRPLSSNGSPSSLFIDTSRLSPNNSDTLSANEICEISRCSSIDAFIQTEDYSQSLPGFHSINPKYLSQLEDSSVHREALEVIEVDRDDDYLPIVKEIPYPDVMPPHDSATVYFGSSDPLEVDHKSDAVENKIYTPLEGLEKSPNELGSHSENHTEFFNLKPNNDNVESDEREAIVAIPLSE